MARRLIILFALWAGLAAGSPALALDIPAGEGEAAAVDERPLLKQDPLPKLAAPRPNSKASAAPDEDAQPVYNTVIVQGLNKVTGHISRIEGKTGAVMHFGTLEITARRCWKSPPDERPENAALLEIRELLPGEGERKIFLGWMFSSSPGLSGLEHAVYDITMLSCEFRSDEKKKEDAAEKKTEKEPEKKKPAKKSGKSGKKSSGKSKKTAKP